MPMPMTDAVALANRLIEQTVGSVDGLHPGDAPHRDLGASHDGAVEVSDDAAERGVVRQVEADDGEALAVEVQQGGGLSGARVGAQAEAR
ncbi:hypothetical protein GCM10025876_25790 [Demequina litorisediminis]|uniref:Uncharacterized protein n=1 Tax=Demequina litorisediminis TaxID=1849022 RepID=A0ABQ6IGF2_9MICO|nr:hypothetical protein GCM10025876_25790 [Demequina litorisediminis]